MKLGRPKPAENASPLIALASFLLMVVFSLCFYATIADPQCSLVLGGERMPNFMILLSILTPCGPCDDKPFMQDRDAVSDLS
jgi:hypothetical protein